MMLEIKGLWLPYRQTYPQQKVLKSGPCCGHDDTTYKCKSMYISTSCFTGEPITNYSCCQGDAGSPGCCVGKVCLMMSRFIPEPSLLRFKTPGEMSNSREIFKLLIEYDGELVNCSTL